ncbi:MAG: tetratricopeptide repeat protein [Bacteroidetes bacterium]|nr:tetratricopeptide repeat protein [Bacteroidota bacterium]
MMKKICKILVILQMSLLPFTMSAQENPEAVAHFKKGDTFYRNGDHAEAIAEFDKAIELDGKFVNALLQRGFCRNITKDFEGAVKDFSRVIELEPNHRWAYVSRGSARNKTGEYQLAIDDFNEALKMDPTDQEAYNNRGFSKKLMGNKSGACEDWNTSKKLGNEEARIILKNNNCK